MHYDLVNAVTIVSVSTILFAAVHDISSRIIPNWCSVLVALLGLILRADSSFIEGAISLAIAAAVFGFFVFLFQLGVVGGGDVKLMPAVTLLVPLHDVPALLVLISFAGGALALTKLVYDRLSGLLAPLRTRFGPFLHSDMKRTIAAGAGEYGYRGEGLPYGVAIFFGTLAQLTFQQ